MLWSGERGRNLRLIIHLSGSTIFESEIDAVPPIGTVIRFVTQGYKKGLRSGSVVEITLNRDDPPCLDFTEIPSGTVILDANGYELIKAGPEID